MKSKTVGANSHTPQANSDRHNLLRPSEVAEQLKVTVATLESWRTRGGPLPFIRLSGRAVRYRQSDVDAFVEQSLVTPQPSRR